MPTVDPGLHINHVWLVSMRTCGCFGCALTDSRSRIWIANPGPQLSLSQRLLDVKDEGVTVSECWRRRRSEDNAGSNWRNGTEHFSRQAKGRRYKFRLSL